MPLTGRTGWSHVSPRIFKGKGRASVIVREQAQVLRRYVGVKKSVIRFGPASKGATGDPERVLHTAQKNVIPLQLFLYADLKLRYTPIASGTTGRLRYIFMIFYDLAKLTSCL
jgi:hypothetical protein